MTIQDVLNTANPNQFPDGARSALLGDGLAMNVPRTELLTIAANLGTPSIPARQILRCFATVGGTAGNKAVAAPETTPGAGNCVVDELGRIEFAAADGVTQAEVTYIPVEGELVTETIPVTAGGVGTLLNGKSAISMVSAALVAPAATPGAKVQVARGTLVGALAAGQYAVQFAGTTLAFVAAEAAAVCTATVSYYALPGTGTGVEDTFGNRLEADDYDDAGI